VAAAPVEAAAAAPAEVAVASVEAAMRAPAATVVEWVVVRAAVVEAEIPEGVEAEIAEVVQAEIAAATDSHQRRRSTRGGSDTLSAPFASHALGERQKVRACRCHCLTFQRLTQMQL
jgi:hypothetical protein